MKNESRCFFLRAVLVPPPGELIRGQGHRLLPLVAVFMAVPAGYGGGLASGSHTGKGFMQKGIEAFAVFVYLLTLPIAVLPPWGLGCMF